MTERKEAQIQKQVVIVEIQADTRHINHIIILEKKNYFGLCDTHIRIIDANHKREFRLFGFLKILEIG